MRLAESLEAAASLANPPSVETFVRHIDATWIEEALIETGTATLRRRRLPATQVIWLVLGMALFRNRSITEVVAKLNLALPGSRGPTVARSAVSQARQRLGSDPLHYLFERCADRWSARSAEAHQWRELSLYGVDGTTLRVPDSEENRRHFGGQSGGAVHGESGYPLVRLVALMVLRSHLLAAVQFGPYTTSEKAYAKGLWSSVPDNALTIVDRGFLDAGVLIPLAATGNNRHWLTRARRDHKSRVIKRLGKGDMIVEANVSSVARQKDPSLPKVWTMRWIEYRRAGFAPQVLLTSLTDAKRYPADEIIALYHERWELELGNDEIKTDMLERQESIRSQSPDGVVQEVWGIALAYNLVRLEIEQVAAEAMVPPVRVSFIAALRLIRDEWMWSAVAEPGAIPRHLRELRRALKDFILPERRSERSYPRVVKIKMSNYNRKRPISRISSTENRAK